jgi:hypothetical protein
LLYLLISVVKMFVQVCLSLILKQSLVQEVSSFSLVELVETHICEVLNIFHQECSTRYFGGSHVSRHYFMVYLFADHVLL